MCLNRQRQDRKVFTELIRALGQKKTPSTLTAQLVIEIGKFFLGETYRAGTLERKGAEHLVVNLRKHDCFTFVENVVALAWFVTSRKESFDAFRRLLLKIRSRQGKVQGYPSRLHYFSDWIHDNQKKGLVRDVTADVGGRPLIKAITFMTTHPDIYPPLRNAVNLR